MHVCMCVCMYICMCVCINACMYFGTTVACLPPNRDLEKCRVIGHNPHFSSQCFSKLSKPKGVTEGNLTRTLCQASLSL